MSSCCASVGLLVLLGAVVAFSHPGIYISNNMSEDFETVADVLKLKEPEIGGRPPFSSVIRSINSSCLRRDEVLLMNATLDIYTRIFSTILQHSEPSALLDRVPKSSRPQLHSALTKLQHKMEVLKTHLAQLTNSKEDVINKLNKIQVDNTLEQRRALAQFLEIYQVASTIGSRSCGHAHSSSTK